jgi:TRAP-type C4-dicarboxylate transport system substrate-binding protein
VFYDSLGATLAPVAPAEVFTALERGVIDGTGFPNLGLTDLGWERLLKYRIFPTFWQGDISLIVNADSWKKLDPKARDLIETTVVSAEKSAHEFFQTEVQKEEAKLKAAGMKDVMQSPQDAKKYAAAAYGALWSQLEKRLSKQDAAALRRTFYKE